MKAIQLVKYGNSAQAFKIIDVLLNEPKSDEVQIEVERFGLNYADVQARKGLYREAPPLPCVLGYEVVGKIVKVGKDVSQEWINKRVISFTRFGGYSQLVNSSYKAIVEIGDYDGNKALCLATQYVTAYYMSHVATTIQKGDNVLIHAAAGGVGTALIQLLQDRDVNIIAKVGSNNKIEYLKDLGVKHIVNYKKSEYSAEVKRILGTESLHASFNPAAGSTFKKDFKLLGPTGKLILFGASELSEKWGILSQLNFVRKMGLMMPIALMMTSKSILGINMLKVADYKPDVLQNCLQAVVQRAIENKLDPKVGAIYNARDIAQAHEFLASGESIGKLVVEW
ncbi:MAG: zinc-binding dehydrogenase [Brumimicrobium sp.]|nr:zinc-binding dehydrogenase [Brumimicrobium sp.]